MKGDMSLFMKKKVMANCILPYLTYGSQTGTYTKRLKEKHLTCQVAMKRSILGIQKIQKFRHATYREKENK